MSAAWTAANRSPLNSDSTRCAKTSVSVSDEKMWPSAISDSLSVHEVGYDAVVHDRQLARAVGERVRVLGRRLALGRPPGVRDPERALHLGHGPLEHGDLALALEYLQAVADDGDARGVVPPVLQPLQAVDEYGLRVPPASVANYTAHPTYTPQVTSDLLGRFLVTLAPLETLHPAPTIVPGSTMTPVPKVVSSPTIEPM